MQKRTVVRYGCNDSTGATALFWCADMDNLNHIPIEDLPVCEPVRKWMALFMYFCFCAILIISEAERSMVS